MILDEFDSKKHSGIIAKFREIYLKNGINMALVNGLGADIFLECFVWVIQKYACTLVYH